MNDNESIKFEFKFKFKSSELQASSFKGKLVLLIAFLLITFFTKARTCKPQKRTQENSISTKSLKKKNKSEPFAQYFHENKSFY